MPAADVPASTQSNIVLAMRSKYALTVSWGRTASSFVRTRSAMLRPDASHAASSCAPDAKGCGAGTSMPTPAWLVASEDTSGFCGSSFV